MNRKWDVLESHIDLASGLMAAVVVRVEDPNIVYCGDKESSNTDISLADQVFLDCIVVLGEVVANNVHLEAGV